MERSEKFSVAHGLCSENTKVFRFPCEVNQCYAFDKLTGLLRRCSERDIYVATKSFAFPAFAWCTAEWIEFAFVPPMQRDIQYIRIVVKYLLCAVTVAKSAASEHMYNIISN